MISLLYIFQDVVKSFRTTHLCAFVTVRTTAWTAVRYVTRDMVGHGEYSVRNVRLPMCDQMDSLLNVISFDFLRYYCLLYTSDAADDMQCVDLGGRRIIKKTRIYGRS